MKSSEIRQAFIDFFIEKKHVFVTSSPLAPANDPTLLFTNAGMNQFKDVFLGQGTRPYTRAVNSQTCIRVAGKHNDLEDVGLDTTHHTLFEMLGNWSFADYGKKEAIAWAWQLLTEVYGFPKDKLYATVYHTDHESETLWRSTTDISPDHVCQFAEKDNFWEMGDVGPCGPCSELHFDRGSACCDKPHVTHVCEVNGVCNRYIELWNLVFIQYNREKDGTLTPLPSIHVDTGAGLERLAACLQHTSSNYETDLFWPIIQTIESLSGVAYSDTEAGMPHRVMADHVRALTFSIAENVLPSNEGRGYVMRRLLRRALRYATKLGIHEPVLYKLVAPVVASMGSHFDAIVTRQHFIESVIRSEETHFLKTLELGIGHFEQVAEKLISENRKILSGTEAFKLYDTFGFPLDLTEVMAKERGVTVDTEGFLYQMDLQKTRSRQSINVQDALLKDRPVGGEARLVNTLEEKLGMARHHSTTHLVHAALRTVLGDHVHQAGSLVDVDHFRFDFTHFETVSQEMIQKIESLVNEKIQENIPVTIFEKPLEEAKKMGAMALFGEKYDTQVRVVQMGDFSMELCAGHHVKNTAEIEGVKLTHHSAIAAGVRRIEGIAGHALIDHCIALQQEGESQEKAAKRRQFEALQAEILAYGGQVQEYDDGRGSDCIKVAEKALSQAKQCQVGSLLDTVIQTGVAYANGQLIVYSLQKYDVTMLKMMADRVVQAHANYTVVLAGVGLENTSFVVKCGPTMPAIAPDILAILTQVAGGKGGGKGLFAQAGGADSCLVDEALQAVHKRLLL